MRLAGSVFDRSGHVCAFFNSKDEEFRVLLPFIQEGFEVGDKAFHIVDGRRCADHLRHLAQAGIDVTTAQDVGQFGPPWEEGIPGGALRRGCHAALIEVVLTAASPRDSPDPPGG